MDKGIIRPAEEERAQEIAALRQQVMALASVNGVLVAALRQARLMTPELEALLCAGLAEAAAAGSPRARAEWQRIATAVQKVAAAAGGAAPARPVRRTSVPRTPLATSSL